MYLALSPLSSALSCLTVDLAWSYNLIDLSPFPLFVLTDVVFLAGQMLKSKRQTGYQRGGDQNMSVRSCF